MSPFASVASRLPPEVRQDIGIQVLSRSQPISRLADNEEFIQQRFEHPPDLPVGIKLSGSPRCVRLPEKVDAVIAAIPKKERSAWMHQAICQAVIDQGLLNEIY